MRLNEASFFLVLFYGISIIPYRKCTRMTSRSVIPDSEIERKMATLDDSPSLFSGQQWTDWAESVLPDNESGNIT